MTQAERDQVRAWHAEGVGRNEIARRLGRAKLTVDRIAAQLGLDFTSTDSQRQAVERRAMDLKARRAELAAGLLEDAARLREQMFAPAAMRGFVGRDGVYREHGLTEPEFQDKLHLMRAANTALQASLRLTEFDQEESSAQARSMLQGLAEALGLRKREEGEAP